MDVRELLLPVLIIGLATLLLSLLAKGFVGDQEGAGIVVSVFLLLFFSYGSVRDALRLRNGLPLVVVSAVLCLVAARAVKKQRSRMRDPALIMTVVGLALVAMPALSAVSMLVRRQQVRVTVPNVEAPAAGSSERPDIYYIILDGYARGDVLEDIYRYDNTPFLDQLAARGFYVAEQSRANYAQTYLSVASSLNFSYLDDVASQAGRDSDDRQPLAAMVSDNALARFLRQLGYTYVTFSTGYLDRELARADVHTDTHWSSSILAQGLIDMSPLASLAGSYEKHRQRLLYALDHLQDATEVTGPVFVLAHIVVPHPPFVFTEDGGRATPDRSFSLRDGADWLGPGGRAAYADGYIRQLSFVSEKILATIDAIIGKSARSPIIILQSDHGPGSMLDWSSPERTNMKERMSILNAYYLPGDGHDGLYAGITPVNTFRLIFNEYFGADYEMLKDESYFSVYDRPYDFIRVPAPRS